MDDFSADVRETPLLAEDDQFPFAGDDIPIAASQTQSIAGNPLRPPRTKISMFQCWLVLMNIIIGIGLLSIPYCFKTGIFSNAAILFLIGMIAYFSFILLIDAAVNCDIPIDYGRLMGFAFGTKYEWVPNGIIFVTFAGVAALHLQFACDLLRAILQEIEMKRHVASWLYNRWFLIMVPAVVIDLPLTLIRTIGSFSRVSLATCFLILLYLTHSAVYLGVGIHEHGFDPDGQVVFASMSQGIVQSISIQAFAFHCHPTVGPTMLQFLNPTKYRQYKLMAAVVGSAAVCYLIGGLLPYLTLLDDIDDVVIFSCYPDGRVFTIVTKVLYATFLLITTPLVLYSARLCLVGLLRQLCKVTITPKRWDAIGVSLLAVIAVLAVLVTSIPLMFDFIGGVTVSIILYGFPSSYYLKLCKGESKVKTVLAWAMMPLGVATIVLCLYDTISRLSEE